MSGAPLVIVSKSTWEPPVRREHALARLAASHGHPVLFVEAPRDVRHALEGEPAEWLARLLRARLSGPVEPGVVRVARSTVVPAHRSAGAEAAERVLLGRALARLAPARATIVATAPWHWPAVAATPAARHVFDCADDWSRLLPGRRAAFTRAWGRIAREADAVSAASEGLAALFPRSSSGATVVRNGAAAEVLEPPPAPPPGTRRAVYVGTLSERLDHLLLGELARLLPGWRVDLHGACQYPGRGTAPAPALLEALRASEGRVAWHGVLARSAVAHTLDRADVCLLPFRRRGAVTGDAMKLYDYAARGRPVVTTPWSDELSRVGPPHLYVADGPAEFAAAVLEAVGEPGGYAGERRAWAAEQRWERRWPAWAGTLFGPAQQAA